MFPTLHRKIEIKQMNSFTSPPLPSDTIVPEQTLLQKKQAKVSAKSHHTIPTHGNCRINNPADRQTKNGRAATTKIRTFSSDM
jgi:hypothetical protein